MHTREAFLSCSQGGKKKTKRAVSTDNPERCQGKGSVGQQRGRDTSSQLELASTSAWCLGAEVHSHSGTGADRLGDAMGKSSSPPAAWCSISWLGDGAGRQVEQGFEASQALPRFAPFPWLRNLAEGESGAFFFFFYYDYFPFAKNIGAGSLK